MVAWLTELWIYTIYDNATSILNPLFSLSCWRAFSYINQRGHLLSEKLNYKPDSNTNKNFKWRGKGWAVCKIKCKIKTKNTDILHCKKKVCTDNDIVRDEIDGYN